MEKAKRKKKRLHKRLCNDKSNATMNIPQRTSSARLERNIECTATTANSNVQWAVRRLLPDGTNWHVEENARRCDCAVDCVCSHRIEEMAESLSFMDL